MEATIFDLDQRQRSHSAQDFLLPELLRALSWSELVAQPVVEVVEDQLVMCSRATLAVVGRGSCLRAHVGLLLMIMESMDRHPSSQYLYQAAVVVAFDRKSFVPLRARERSVSEPAH